ncbi:MAG TPA: sugar ABC transporter permease [Paenibacillus sp.]|nr:sugar ABC transporter permease [Paenibacillus sp.]
MERSTPRRVPYLFLLPALLLLFVFKLYPIAASAIGSLYRGDAFVGLGNYASLFQDRVFGASLKATLLFNVFVNPIQIGLALALAVLANRKLKGIGVIRSILYLPVVVSIAVTCVVWGIMLNPNGGVVNGILNAVGIASQPFLTSADQALPSIILMTTWKGVAYWMMFLLAGLQDIPEHLHEAARIDGAGRWNALFRVTIPLLKRPLAFVIVADTVANMLMFAPNYVLTKGGPELSNHFLMYEAFSSAYRYVDMGRAYSITTLLLVIVFVIVGAQMRLMRTDH